MRRALAGVGTAAALALTACGGGGNSDGTADAVASDTSSALPPSTSAAPSSSEAPDPALSPRGNIIKVFGQDAGFTAEDGSDLITFAVDSITPDVPCTEEYAEDPENGHFAAVQMRWATSPQLETDAYFAVSPSDFRFVGSDGLTVDNLATFPAFTCLDEGVLLTTDPLAPGSQYAGTILLDLPETTGVLIYAPPGGMSNGGGWEWVF